MEQVKTTENTWQEINNAECEENSLFDMCSWAEAN